MRRFKPTIAAAVLGAGLLALGSPAWAQEPFPATQAPQPAFDVYIPPFVWNGNALDQKILDAQAQMIPLRRASSHTHRTHHSH